MIEFKNVTTIFAKQRSRDLIPLVEKEIDKDELLEKYGGTLALNRINLSIPTGEIFVVMGLSGSGKSTLARHINLLIRPTAGEIHIDGENILDYGRKEIQNLRRFNVSMVFQRFGLLPHKSVFNNVALGLMAQNVTKSSLKDQVHYWIEFVGLKGYEDFTPGQLSGGMQQRVGLARALATGAKILVMDEAFSALDPIIRAEMQSQLLEIQTELQRTVVFITHDLNEAIRVGSKITILKDGSIVQIGTPQEIVDTPVNDFVASFVKAVPQLSLLPSC